MANTFTIVELSGTTTNNYPIQIGRPFVEGEIANYPQVSISGTLIETQADVKNRWEDGSVKFAVISFYVPTLSANRTVYCSIVNQATGNNTGYMTSANMLSATYDFNATISITSGGNTFTTSARPMITDSKYSYWLQGSICTSIIIADFSVSSSYDMGFDVYKSFKPIFHVTFWPLINKTKIRYIGEVCNGSKLQTFSYSLLLTKGNSTNTSAYSKSTFSHSLASRWTKDFWIGDPPNRINLDHNLSYLTSTKLIFNYDPTKTISQSTMNSLYVSWNNSSRDIYDSALLTLDQGSPGGRPEIGPVDGWSVKYLYTGDFRMKEISNGISNLAAAWPVHFREGNPSKNIQGSTSGLGKVMSIRNRPTIVITDPTYDFTLSQDKVTIVGSTGSNSWNPDAAHMPDLNTVSYLLTGEFWHLEELYFWASWSAMCPNGAAYEYSYGRGPTGAEGGIPYSQVRGQAWTFRTRVHAATFAPDGTIEKTYFETLIDDAIAGWEGTKEISGTSFEGNSMWDWARTHYYFDLGPPPLHQWYQGSDIYNQSDYGIDESISSEASSNFEQHFMMLALGRAYELGYPVDSLVEDLSIHYINVLTNADYNKYLLANGRIPSVKVSDGQYFNTWASLKTGYDSQWRNTSAYPLSDPTHGYDFLGLAASSYLIGDGSESAWNVVESLILPASVLNNEPTWAIIMRESTDVPVLTRIDIISSNVRLRF